MAVISALQVDGIAPLTDRRGCILTSLPSKAAGHRLREEILIQNKFRYVVAGLLFLAAMINFIDRSALSIVAPVMTKELHIEPAMLGILFSAFFASYTIFGLFGGFIIDRFSPKWFYAGAMLVWSIFCGLTAVATSFTQLMIFRIIFGMGESPMSPVTTKMTRNWFPRDELGMVMGITPPAGNMLGAAVAGPLVGFVAVGYGWRMSFVVVMVIGLVWTLLWTIFARDRPQQSPFVTEAELAIIGRGSNLAPRPSDEDALSVWHYAKSPAVLATAAGFFASNYILYFFITWLPSYLTDARHLDIKTMSIVTVIPWLLGATGSVAGGVLADWLLRLTGRPVFCRKIMVSCGLALSAVALLLTTQTSSLTMVIVLIAIANICLHVTPGSTWVLLQELVPASRLGVVSGYVSGLANLSGIIGPAITGFIIQYGGGYGSSFVLAGLVAICSSLAVMLFVRDRGGVRPLPLGGTHLRTPS